MIYDVAIVGYGPVGQSLSIMLAQRGYRVAVFDRWPDIYPLPRAVFHDHEIRRVFKSMGIGDEVGGISQPSARYQWFNADWKILVEIDWSAESISDGPFGYLFNQPALEAILDRKAQSYPSVTIGQGWEATSLRQLAEYCELDLRRGAIVDGKWNATGEVQSVSAKYVIGADGANSFVRRVSQIVWEDLGFDEDWLVVDLQPNAGVKLDVPDIGQWCNPARPTTMVPGGLGYRRWEFMRLPGESTDGLQQIDKVWELLSPWVTPNNAKLIRHAVYRFRSLIASQWRSDRVLLAGDAAHLMPPFMGQGMCSGIRDAWNLAWRIDLILRGAASDKLLDSYTPERRPQVRAVIDASITMGRVVCIADTQEAARRDEAFLAGNVPPLPPFPGLVHGVIHQSSDGKPEGLAGQLSPHSTVERNGQTLRYDEAVPSGFHVVTHGITPDELLDQSERAFLRSIGATTVGLTDDQAKKSDHSLLFDTTGKYSRYFAEHVIKALLVRPDFYLYGTAATTDGLHALIAELHEQLHAKESLSSECTSPPLPHSSTGG
jgi:3-(3-hydroxy-phenyl)propionate hydroxylase